MHQPTHDVAVAIASHLRVPLVMPMLDAIDDGALRKEIAEEAVRLSITEHLGGFDGVAVEESSATVHCATTGRPVQCRFKAAVCFNDLSRCIGALQSEYQRVLHLARDMQEVVTQLQIDGSCSETAIQALKEGLASIVTPTINSNGGQAGTDVMPELVEEDANHKGEGRRLLDASDESDDSDVDGDTSPEAAGYVRMCDD
jgi:hypothetical protein